MSRSTLALLLFALGVYLVYFSQTRFDVRNFDAAAHLNYIQFIALKHALPDAAQCSVCHHPPAYHLIAAGLYAVCERAGLDAARGLQALSLLIWLGFVTLAALTIERLVEGRMQRMVATALVALWPYSIVQSVRVNNDTLVDALAAAVIYFSVRWMEQRRACFLVAASACALLGLFTKASALTLVALLCAVLARELWKDGRIVLRSAWPLAALLAATVIWSGLRGHHASVTQNILGGAAQTASSRGARFYLGFSPRAMLTAPYAQVIMARSDEPTYWNQLAKSSLYGSRTFGKFPPNTVHPSRRLVMIENGMLLLLGALLLLALALGRRRRELLLAAVFVAGGLAFHLLAPNDHHADFRFILPILIPLSAIYADALRPRWLRFFGAGVAAIFLTVSVVSLTRMAPDPADAEQLQFPLRPFRTR